MKCFAITALISAAIATAAYEVEGQALVCSPPAYACKPDFSGWLVCNVDGFYIDGGDCAPDAWCEYINNLPYCIN
ncbi:hypothetical protein M426DRAFT_9811 [Hypoxylon sp. CI-4A]|nr:hypothetical protein M426DRAFT_9811 [Hypoxylon sp. CI-4A]